MNSESELTFDTRAILDLAGEILIGTLLGLLFGLLGIGLAVLRFSRVFTFTVVISYLAKTYKYSWPTFFDALVIPVAATFLSLAVLRPLIERVHSRKSWLLLTSGIMGISTLLFLLYCSWHPYIFPSDFVYVAWWMLDSVTPIGLLMWAVVFMALTGLGFLLQPRTRRMKIVALAKSASAFALLWQIAVLWCMIGGPLANYAAP